MLDAEARANALWHARSAQDVAAEFQTSDHGLSEVEARRRLTAFGLNALPPAERRHALIRFLGQFHNALIYVLIGAAAITALLDHWTDAGVILAVVVANAVIGFVQEGRADRAMDSIRRMLAPRASVVRDEHRRSVPGESVVPGDVVLLEAGDRVPADMRLIEVAALRVQEAVLTGESVPVDKGIEPVASAAPLGDRASMAYSGTMIVAGQGKGIVVATGGATEIGRISGLLGTVETLTTPLVQQIGAFGKWLTILILLMASILLAFGYFVAHFEFFDLFMAVVGLSVAAIPEGLPAVLTITLAVGVRRMAERNAIVRRLPAIETVGAVSVICTDKTGTLTRNEMLVATAVASSGCWSVGGQGYEPSGTLKPEGAANGGALALIGRVAALCNDADLHAEAGAWSVEGDPMEGALLAFAGKAGFDWGERHRRWPRIGAIPFDPKRRFMATAHADTAGLLVCVKGAPERVLDMAAWQTTPDGEREPIDRDYWRGHADAVAAKGQRVLALAQTRLPDARPLLEPALLEGTLSMVGLLGLIDPPRAEAIAAVAECLGAGIDVKMITGDHAGTAAAIGAAIGLRNSRHVLTGADLDEMDDAALVTAAFDTDIFARTSPEDKLRLVTVLQSRGSIVAMTGDGVNDAPALKRADAGIAMGLKGSEAAKEAADLVLADDNFASIAAAVREGRTVYDNIKKVISWTLPTNAGEAMTIIVALLFGLAMPITPIQILWINLVTAVTLGLALAFEPTEAASMRRPPRARGEGLLDGALVWHIIFVSLLFLAGVYGVYAYAIDRGYSLDLARTISVNTLVVLEIFHLYYVRNIYGTNLTWAAVRGTPIVWSMTGAIVAAQFAITYVPALQRVFGTAAVSGQDGVLVVCVGVVFFAILEVEKQIRLRLAQAHAVARGLA